SQHTKRPPTERAQDCGGGTEAKIGGDRHSTRSQRFRERLSNGKAKAGHRDYDNRRPLFFHRKKANGSLPPNTGCRLFAIRSSLSMRVVSCPMERTSMPSIGARPFTWTRS